MLQILLFLQLSGADFIVFVVLALTLNYTVFDIIHGIKRNSTPSSIVENLGRLTWVKHSSHTSSATHSYQRVQSFHVS